LSVPALYSVQSALELDELYNSNPQARGAIVSRVDYPKLETALLKDVDDTYYYGANCRSCLHASRLSLSKLRAHLGGDFPVAKIRERLKCELCGGKQVVVTYLTPSQSTGSLVHLFEKKPRE
jgi:hypothetical protein